MDLAAAGSPGGGRQFDSAFCPTHGRESIEIDRRDEVLVDAGLRRAAPIVVTIAGHHQADATQIGSAYFDVV